MEILRHYRALIFYTFNRFKGGNYARMQAYFARVTLKDIERFVPLAGKRVLDVGGGHGSLCRVFETERPGCRATNLEPADNMIGEVWHDTLRAGAEAIPAGDGTYDVVTCLGVIEHLPPAIKKATLAEMHRVLKPGGFAYIVTQPWWNPNAGHHLKPFHVLPFPIAKFLRAKIFGTKGMAITGKSYADETLFPSTFRQMRDLINASGLRYVAGIDTHLRLDFLTRIPIARELFVPTVGFVAQKQKPVN
jgi:SAM-dependent methyltransferase